MELEFLELTQEIPQSMPILDEWVRRQRSSKPLQDVTALFIQHQFGNQVPQTKALIELGLLPERILWVDVPYTSNALVRKALTALGIPPKNLLVADDYRVLEPYAPYQRRRVQNIVHKLLDSPPQQLLVLDDGAYFVEAASCFRKRFRRVVVVEQTTRGVIKVNASPAMHEYASEIPVVNVAESAPKRKLEAPFIGRAVCSALVRKLGTRFEPPQDHDCLILGYGAIGQQVAQFLLEYLRFPRKRIFVYDPQKTSLRAAREDGYSIWDRRSKQKFDLVIGCSGLSSFRVHDYIFLNKDAFLASASSGSVELSREDFIELADSSPDDDIEIIRKKLDQAKIHSDLEFNLVDRKATFLNAGFPVNFLGQVNCVPTQYMQPTATMMVAATLQALSTNEKGLIPLDKRFCNWLTRRFVRELGNSADRFLHRGGRAAKVGHA